MKETIVEQLRRRAIGCEDEAEIEAAFSEIDARLRSLVESIDTARVDEPESGCWESSNPWHGAQ